MIAAGRELDALVAKKVMGWKYSQISPNIERFFCRQYGQQSGWWLRPEMNTEDGWACAKCSDVPLSYSTDIAAAWEMVQRVMELGFQDWTLDCGGEYIFYAKGHKMARINSGGDTAPHAICLAALKAVE